jgi:transcriptional regulator with XRE-family HTH domain
MTFKNAADFNKAMGAVLRREMSARDMTLETLGKAIGVAYQQIGKYACGQNGLSAFRLQQIAKVLGVSVTYLYEQAGVQVKAGEPSLADRDGQTAARCIANIRDKKTRDALIAHLRRIAALEAA